MAHIGVRNRTDAEQYLVFDGKPIRFAPKGSDGYVRLVEGIAPDFVESRMHISHPTKTDPQTGEIVQLKTVQGLRLFDVMPLDEAIKAGARPEEDPRAIAAREAAERKMKERAQLLSELKASLVQDGWEPPMNEKKEPAKGKGGK